MSDSVILKKVKKIISHSSQHWVGDGFPVRNFFSYQKDIEIFSPYILFDYAGPFVFEATKSKKGVGPHPHRGLETVTLVYSGEVAHRDSSGVSGTIGPGDIQWMSAASGLVHEEYHSQAFAQTGGLFEVIQLWVNLPRSKKMSQPNYQEISKQEVPVIELDHGSGGYLRIIAGTYGDQKGPAKTHTPMILWDGHLKANQEFRFEVPEGWNSCVFIRQGEVLIQDENEVSDSRMIAFEREKSEIHIKAKKDSDFVILAGEPIDEPTFGYGPFVMNTEEEIKKAYQDYRSGKMGVLKN